MTTRMRASSGTLSLLFILALLALIIGPLRTGTTAPFRLPLKNAEGSSSAGGSFIVQGTPSGTDTHFLRGGIETWGSFSERGNLAGSYEGDWHETQRRLTVMVAGFPRTGGNRLEVDFRLKTGQVLTEAYTGEEPGRAWRHWFLVSPKGCEAVRVRAVSGGQQQNGWLAFSEPFAIKFPLTWQALTWVQLLCAVALALVALYGPGLFWLGGRERIAGADLALATLPGPLVGLALGLLCWAVDGVLAPQLAGRLLVGFLLMALFLRRDRVVGAWLRLPSGAKAVLCAGALLVGFGAAKANIWLGTPGELYGDSISRSLEVGGHSDSRVSFHVVQVVANHQAPFDERSSGYFAPWTFASRGPVAGILATPLVLATGAEVPLDMPDHSWGPFDAQGFAVYRIALMALASLAAWAVFGLLANLGGLGLGLFGASAALLAPFFVHELYFTWPKLVAAGLVLSCFALLRKERHFGAGHTLAFAYLFHPLPLLSAPFLGLWLLFRGERRFAAKLVEAFRFSAGLALPVGAWVLFGIIGTGSAGSQSGFAGYFFMADNATATWATWWDSRWQNLANTFVPFHLLRFPEGHESINAIYQPSPWWVRLGFLYWNTLPFALGLPLFLLVAASFVSASWRKTALFALFVAGPALFLVAYWGAADSGLMRHCGQVLFLSVIVFAIWYLFRYDAPWRRSVAALFLHPACFAFRGLEVAVMAFGTSMVGGFPHWGSPLVENDLVSLAAALVCLCAATVVLAKAARAEASA